MEEAQIMKVKQEASVEPIREEQSIKLGLGIGGGDSSGSGSKLRSNKKRKKKSTSVFSVDQLKELEQQRLIFNYLAAGLPVPFYLVLPYWKSTVTTFGGSNPDFYKQFPSFVRFGGFEPGRCRRTDGKKWRCSRDIVPDENYCEKHIHRGRNRSRKPVETSELTSPSTIKLQKNSEGEVLNSSKNHQNSTPSSSAKLLKNSEGEALNSNTNHQSSTHKGLQLMAQSSNFVTVCHGPTTFSSSYHEFEKNISTVTVESPTNAPSNRTATALNVAATTATTAERVNAITSPCNENNLLLGVKYNSSSHPDSNGVIRGSRNNTNLSNNISLGSGFSPKSVLQGRHMILVGCDSLCSKNGSGTDIEPGRCRRTDGKKWRCKRDVLPDQKYCDRHIHRGVKQMRSSQCATSTSAAATNNSHPSQNTTVAKEIDCAIPNTNLTMSIPARSPLIQNVEKSNSSCDSDATVTDTSLAAYEQPI